MRRIILQPGEQFTNAHLKRTGAFNAQALTAATAIIEACASAATRPCAPTPSSSTACAWRSSACRRRLSQKPS